MVENIASIFLICLDLLACLWLGRVALNYVSLSITRHNILLTIFCSLWVLFGSVLGQAYSSSYSDFSRDFNLLLLFMYALATLGLLNGTFFLPSGTKTTYWRNKHTSTYLGLLNLIFLVGRFLLSRFTH